MPFGYFVKDLQKTWMNSRFSLYSFFFSSETTNMVSEHLLLLASIRFHLPLWWLEVINPTRVLWADLSSHNRWRILVAHFIFIMETILGLLSCRTLWLGTIYNTWSRAMMMALTAKNKVGFVDGTISCVAADDLLYNAWICCNSMIISWLLNFISREIVDSLMHSATTCEIWNDLRDHFCQSNAPHIFQLKKHLITL